MSSTVSSTVSSTLSSVLAGDFGCALQQLQKSAMSPSQVPGAGDTAEQAVVQLNAKLDELEITTGQLDVAMAELARCTAAVWLLCCVGGWVLLLFLMNAAGISCQKMKMPQVPTN